MCPLKIKANEHFLLVLSAQAFEITDQTFEVRLLAHGCITGLLCRAMKGFHRGAWRGSTVFLPAFIFPKF